MELVANYDELLLLHVVTIIPMESSYLLILLIFVINNSRCICSIVTDVNLTITCGP